MRGVNVKAESVHNSNSGDTRELAFLLVWKEQEERKFQ